MCSSDLWTGYVGEVFNASGHTGTVDTVHIREQTQIEGDLIEDGVEGGGSLEDGAGQVPGPSQEHLHEAWSMMRPSLFDFMEWVAYIVFGLALTGLMIMGIISVIVWIT